MPPQRPVFRVAALAGICAGVGVLANAVKVTLGPKGRLVVLERLFGSPIIAHSGVTVARGIELADRIENMGASMVREVAKKTMEKARDGTTTATMLAQAIVMGGCGPIVASSPPISSCRGKSRWRCRISRTSWCATARFPVSAICCRAGQPAVDHYATKVTHHALANAAFIAGLILTTDCTIAEAPESMREAGGYQISDNLARIIVACAG